RVAAPHGLAGEPQRLTLRRDAHLEAHRLDRRVLVRRSLSIARLVALVEPVRHRDRGRVGERAGWHGHAHVVDLSLVLHVRGAEGREVAAAVRDGTRAAELFDRVTLEPREDLAPRRGPEGT